MDERKDPLTGGSYPAGVRPGERTVHQETDIHIERDVAREREPERDRFGPSGYDDRERRGRYDPRERYDVDREGRFGSDSGRIRAGIDHTRSEIDQTVAALQDRLSPDRLMHRVMDMFSGGKGESSRMVMETIRRNPVPAALIGLGLGWLALEKTGTFERYSGYRSGPRRGREHPEHGDYDDRDWLAPGAVYYPPGSEPREARTGRYEREGPGMLSRAGEMLGSARDKAGDWAHSARETIGGASDRVRSGVSSVRSGVSSVGEHARDWSAGARDRASHLSEQARHGAHVARERIEESYDEYPLAMGGLALAGGLILGLLLPPTRREDRMMGEFRDDLLDRAKDTGQDLFESGKRVAKTAAQAARDEAEREDLTPGTLVRSVQRIAGRAAEAAEETAGQEGERIKEKVVSSAGEAGGALKGGISGSTGGEQRGQSQGQKPSGPSQQSGPQCPP